MRKPEKRRWNMPTSWYQVSSAVMERVMDERPASVLDVGVGFGKYGVLLREALDIPYERYDKKLWTARIDGIEAFEGYRNPLHDYVYDKIYYNTIDECIDGLGDYDVILMIDILEHIPKERGEELVKILLEHTNKALIVSTPVNPAPQEDYMGNSYEAHVSRWTPIDFAGYESDFVTIPIAGNYALVVRIYPTRDARQANSYQRSLDDELVGLTETPQNRDEKLHIAYALPHRALTGGLKMLVEQIRWLKSMGHTVDAYLCGDGDSALPDWMPADVDMDKVIGWGEAFHAHIRPCDVIVAGWYDQIPDLLATKIPVMYWEQGSEPIFGDYGGALYTARIREWHRLMFSLPIVLTAASDFMSDTMNRRYNRNAAVIPNGVDTDFFHPSPKSGGEPTIMMVGNPILRFKRFSTATSVLKQLWNKGRRFRLRWVCQCHPDLSNLPFPVEVKVNAPQKALAELYSTADILLFPSIFEGFGMPPLEAMASGLAVVCTDCGGPRAYLKDGYNALVVQPDNESEMIEALDRLIGDEKLREELSINARSTALDFTLDKSYRKLEKTLYAIKEQRMKNLSEPQSAAV